MMTGADLKKTIREIPDFPKPGINFYDVSTLFRNAEAFRTAVRSMVEPLRPLELDALAAIEARGFVLAAAMAYELGVGLVLIRKFGKLPGDTLGETYALEYGEAHIEIQEDAIEPGRKILVVDDLLATGGTAAAAGRLVGRRGGRLAGYAFMVELEFLEGRRRLEPDPVYSLLHYA
jgi:adenine phosphoribosyltransferase